MSSLPPVGRTTMRAGATRSDASVELTQNLRVVVEVNPWSSSAVTVRVQRPSAGGSGVVGSGGGVPSGGGGGTGGKATSYVPASRSRPSCHAIVPSGAVSVVVVVDGRTTLKESSCVSATPSPLGDTT